MSVLGTIIGKKPNIGNHIEVLELLQKFIIKSKSMSPVKSYTSTQLNVITMYTFGALAYLTEAMNVPEEENILVLDAYLQQNGLTHKQAKEEARSIMEKVEDSSVQWYVEIGYNSSRYWHKDNDHSAPKALTRLLKTLR